MLGLKKILIRRLTDKQLLDEYKSSGNTAYFAEIFERHSYVLLSTCKYYLKDREAAKDAVMQIFEEIREKLLTTDILHIASWLHVVARNHCLMKIRKEEKVRLVFFDGQEEEVKLQVDWRQEDETDDHPIDHLEGCLEKLNSVQKECVNLFYLQEKAYKEICTLTGHTLDQVKSFIQNGKRNLRNCLEGRARI